MVSFFICTLDFHLNDPRKGIASLCVPHALWALICLQLFDLIIRFPPHLWLNIVAIIASIIFLDHSRVRLDRFASFYNFYVEGEVTARNAAIVYIFK